MEMIDVPMTFAVVFGVAVIFGLLAAIYYSYKSITEGPKYNANELLVENTGDVFQRGRYIYYSVNSDILFISPSAPKNGMHPIAHSSAYYVGEL